jgi:hypothetical protein
VDPKIPQCVCVPLAFLLLSCLCEDVSEPVGPTSNTLLFNIARLRCLSEYSLKRRPCRYHCFSGRLLKLTTVPTALQRCTPQLLQMPAAPPLQQHPRTCAYRDRTASRSFANAHFIRLKTARYSATRHILLGKHTQLPDPFFSRVR